MCKGRCRTCGFLAIQELGYGGANRESGGVAPSALLEASLDARECGSLFRIEKGGKDYSARPVCVLQIDDLESEVQQQQRTGLHQAPAGKAVLGKDRRCPEWFEYTAGFDPAKHVELRMNALLQQQQDRISERQEKTDKAMICLNKQMVRLMNWQLFMAACAVVVTVCAVIVTFMVAT